MAGMEIIDIDLEGGSDDYSSSAESDGDGGGSDEEILCFSDADEDSCYSQSYSTADGSYDDCSFSCASDPETGGVPDSRGVSLAAESDCSVYIGNGIREVKVHLGREERDCRICHLSLESTNPETGIAIELGCSCKNDLAAAHKNCAEAWFKIKGNKTCEICNSVARNVFGANEIDSTQQANETNVTATNAVSASVPPTAETRSCLNGHRLWNFLLACILFAFVLSCLFHFDIPS